MVEITFYHDPISKLFINQSGAHTHTHVTHQIKKCTKNTHYPNSMVDDCSLHLM